MIQSKGMQRSGFTLVELMLAIVLSSIVAAAVGLLLVFGNRALIRNRRAVEMQRDVSLAMETIAPRIRSAKIQEGNVSFVNDTLYFEDTHTEGVQWDQGSGELVLLPSGAVLVRDEWDIIDFYAERHDANGTWLVTLQVFDPETRNELVMESSFLPRNK